jgi:hypothetical protein
MGWGEVDALVASVVERSPLRFTVTEELSEAAWAFRLRADAVVAAGWRSRAELTELGESDAYDERAVHIIGWDGPNPVVTGRIVLPPGVLPTEDACGIRVAPVGRVADVGRMVVAPSHQRVTHGGFSALLARLYIEVRRRDFEAACGMMTPAVRVICRQLGVTLETLGPDRLYWGEARAPVRFDLGKSASHLQDRWG